MVRTEESIRSVIKAYDVRGIVGESIDADFVRDVGGAFGCIMREEGNTQVMVGYDMRPSSPELAQAFAEGVSAQGLDVVILGLTSTDELYYASGHYQCPGAMFTASHNPAEYNGIKLCRAGARPVGQETGLNRIVEMLTQDIPAYEGAAGTISERDVLQGYAEYLRSIVDLGQIRPLRIAVDAANGMAGLTTHAVLDTEQIEILPLYFELDGTFPNHEANPLDPANLVDIQNFVRETGADIGLAFDGDADRCFVVDERGEPVSPSAICALIAERTLEAHPGSSIIHNLITSAAVPELIQRKGGTPVRTRVGHSFIKQQMGETGALFGGEHSAHYYFAEFFNADSGMLAALHVIAALGQFEGTLSELMSTYETYVASGEINSRLGSAEAQAERIQVVREDFASRAQEMDELDGLTIRLADSAAWFNVRASNTEPLLRLNVEAPTQAEMESIRDEVLGIIRA